MTLNPEFLEEGFVVDPENEYYVNEDDKCRGWTQLMAYVMCHQTEKVAEYIQKFPETINLQNERGLTALHLACINSKGDSSEEIVELLLNHPDIDVNIQDTYGSTPLIQAIRHLDFESSENTILMVLSHKDINVNIQDKLGWSALMFSCSSSKSTDRTLEKLLNHPDINVNLQDEYGRTALIESCSSVNKFSSNKIVEKLLNHPDIDVNIEDKLMYDTALTVACSGNNSSVETIQLLLNHPDIQVDYKNKHGFTALMKCYYPFICPYPDIIQILVNKSGDINIQGFCGYTALHFACNDSDIPFINIQPLLNHPNINFNLKDRGGGSTPLSLAFHSNKKEVIDFLLNHPGIDIDFYVNSIITNCSDEIICKLLELKGFNLTDKSSDNIYKTILSIINKEVLFTYLKDNDVKNSNFLHYIIKNTDYLPQIQRKCPYCRNVVTYDTSNHIISNCFICYSENVECLISDVCRHDDKICFDCVVKLKK